MLGAQEGNALANPPLVARCGRTWFGAQTRTRICSGPRGRGSAEAPGVQHVHSAVAGSQPPVTTSLGSVATGLVLSIRISSGTEWVCVRAYLRHNALVPILHIGAHWNCTEPLAPENGHDVRDHVEGATDKRRHF